MAIAAAGYICRESERNTHVSHDWEETTRAPRVSRDLRVSCNAGTSSALLFFAENRDLSWSNICII